jgi:hypothetical protein
MPGVDNIPAVLILMGGKTIHFEVYKCVMKHVRLKPICGNVDGTGGHLVNALADDFCETLHEAGYMFNMENITIFYNISM